ncbi:MAG: hypothetical protein WCB49_13375, partial [Gammaproteobacteria bacterium]
EKEGLIQSHPLQPFSARYRAEPRRGASYADEWLGSPESDVRPRVFAPAAPLDREVERIVTLDELSRAFANPARAFQQALGIAIRTEVSLLGDAEPFALDGLGKWTVRDALLARWLEHGERFDSQSCRAEFAARGWLPLGEAGRIAYDAVAAETAGLVGAVRKVIGDGSPEQRDIDLVVGDWHVRGCVSDVYPRTGFVLARAGKLRAKDRLRIWITHLALAAGGNSEAVSHFVGVDKGKAEHVAWGAVDDAEAELEKFCGLYARMQREALPLLPDLSFEFNETANKKGDAAAYGKVKANWHNDKSHADGEKDYAAVMRGRELFGEDFGQCAKAVFGSIISAESKA